MLFCFLFVFTTFAQREHPGQITGRQDTTLTPVDSLKISSDTTTNISSNRIDARITYESNDSMNMDLSLRKVYLFGSAHVTYKNIDLKADYIEIDFNTSEVFAKGLPDSTGKIAGKPVFKQGNEQFESNTLKYNFKTKKGFIRDMITQQEGGYLHGEKTKRMGNGVIDIHNVKYTTCDAPHPHYYVALTKAKVIPGKEIVSGPAYLVVADIPLPVAVPFGFFPNKQTHASGILIPEYGEEKNRGFYLRNGGYYLALNDYFDLSFTGDVYTNGTWGLRAGSNYRKRYKYSGNFNIRYYKNVQGSFDLGNYTSNRDYSIQWSHSQDPKANPTRTFRASVNLSSSSFDKNHSYEARNFLTNTKQSSISFSKIWPGSPFNFTGSLSHSQNSRTKSVDLNLPKLALNMNRIYPFKSKHSIGRHWYDNIEFSYNAMLENRIKTRDSLLFTSQVFNDMTNGFKHTIPLSVNFKPSNNFNISPRIQYSGMLYTRHIEKHYTYVYDTTHMKYLSHLVTDTIHGIKYAHALLPAISLSLNPKIYGMFIFKSPNSKIQAIRHVMTPSVSFSFVPDMKGILPNYYRNIVDTTTNRKLTYSIFEKEIYGTPSLSGKSGIVNFTLNNNLEMKVKAEKDTTSNFKKIKLLESFNFATNYNIFKDSMRWAPVSFNGRTTLWKNNIQLSFGGTMNPYALDVNGHIINKPMIATSNTLFRLTNMNVSFDMHLSGGKKSRQSSRTQNRNMKMPGRSSTGTQENIPSGSPENPIPQQTETEYSYFNIPWDLRIRYNLNYRKPAFVSSVVQTLNISGSFSLTSKWKISGNTGWDFKKRKLTYTSLNIHRDLHCWEMSLSWIPIGYHQSYSFVINVKSSILRDLKYEKRKSWYDR